MRLKDTLGKDLLSGDNPLGKCRFDNHVDLTALGKLACHFGVKDVGEDRLKGKGELNSMFWEWKEYLVSLKAEVDRALHKVLDGIELLGPEGKPNCVGRN